MDDCLPQKRRSQAGRERERYTWNDFVLNKYELLHYLPASKLCAPISLLLALCVLAVDFLMFHVARFAFVAVQFCTSYGALYMSIVNI